MTHTRGNGVIYTDMNQEKKNIRVLLISISKIYKYSNAGIDLIAGFLREKGYQADIVYFHQGETLEQMISNVSLEYDVYGMSVYSSNYESFSVLSEYLKNNSKSTIVWGGAFPSMYYKDILEDDSNIDYIVLGDGEVPLLYMLECLEHNVPVDHISIVSHSNYIGKRNACNGEITYYPAFDYYRFVRPDRNQWKVHCLQTKNNVCTGVCSFCYERKGKIKYKSIDTIINEVRYVSETFGVKKFFFSDDNLLDPNDLVAKERIIELCRNLIAIDKRLIFTCYIKAISFNNTVFDSTVLSLMRKAGFVTMFIGIESGNDEDLKLYNKMTSVSDNLNIIHLLKRHDIIPQVGFINLNPYSTLEKLKQNYEFLSSIHSNNLYNYACSALNLYKGTAIYNKALKDGLIKPTYTILNDLEYDFADSRILPIVEFLRKQLIPEIKKLKVETSWLSQRCKECTLLDSRAEKYMRILEKHEYEEAKIMTEYFKQLYVNNDIGFCSGNLMKIVNYFRQKEPELLEIYTAIKQIYWESET